MQNHSWKCVNDHESKTHFHNYERLISTLGLIYETEVKGNLEMVFINFSYFILLNLFGVVNSFKIKVELNFLVSHNALCQ